MNTFVLFVILTIYVVSGYHDKIPELSRHRRDTLGALEIITNHAKPIHADVKKDNTNTTEKVIETDGIPSHWKRYHKIVNNPDHHKINPIQNKKSSNNILNYGLGVQRPTKVVPSTDLLSYKIMQPTIRNLNSISDSSNKKLCEKSDTKTAHNNENLKVENKNAIYDKEQHIINEHNKDIDQVLEKCPKHTEIENVINKFKNVDTFEEPNHAKIDTVHEKNIMLEMLHPEKNDSSSNVLDKLCRNESLTKRSEEPQEHENITRHNKEQNKNKRNDEFIIKSHDSTEKNPVNTGKIKDDEIRFHDQQNIQANFWHALYNPKGWIRYFMPNQYSLSDNSNNYINKLYSRTKYSNPFYDTQGRFTRPLNYGADIGDTI
ncbi:unnamed protein product, partial [Brenthis ino]